MKNIESYSIEDINFAISYRRGISPSEYLEDVLSRAEPDIMHYIPASCLFEVTAKLSVIAMQNYETFFIQQERETA